MFNLKEDCVIAFYYASEAYKNVLQNLPMILKLALPAIIFYLMLEPVYFMITGFSFSKTDITEAHMPMVLKGFTIIAPLMVAQMLYRFKGARAWYVLFIEGAPAVSDYKLWAWHKKEIAFARTNLMFICVAGGVMMISLSLFVSLGVGFTMVVMGAKSLPFESVASVSVILTYVFTTMGLLLGIIFTCKRVLILPARAQNDRLKMQDSIEALRGRFFSFFVSICLVVLPVVFINILWSAIIPAQSPDALKVLGNFVVSPVTFIAGILITYIIADNYMDLKAKDALI